jgi:ankyrin repeat protein
MLSPQHLEQLSLLNHAAANGKFDQLYQLLINTPRNLLNHQNADISRPLDLACLYGHINCAELLIQSGTHLNFQDHHGWTPLMFACWGGDLDCVQMLITAGANLNLQTDQGRSALMQASLMSQSSCVDALIKAGARLEMQDYDGLTALMIAEDPVCIGLLSNAAQTRQLNFTAPVYNLRSMKSSQRKNGNI